MRKKLLSIILALAMLACMIPMGMVTVSADSVITLDATGYEGVYDGKPHNATYTVTPSNAEVEVTVEYSGDSDPDGAWESKDYDPNEFTDCVDTWARFCATGADGSVYSEPVRVWISCRPVNVTANLVLPFGASDAAVDAAIEKNIDVQLADEFDHGLLPGDTITYKWKRADESYKDSREIGGRYDITFPNEEGEYEELNLTYQSNYEVCYVPGSVIFSTDVLETWDALQNAIDAAPATKTSTIILPKDLTAPDGADSITIPEGKDITIDLDGHVLNANGKSRVITVNAGGKLTVIDSSPATEHKGYMDANGLWQLGTPQSGETAKDLTGGVITGGKAADGGGGVLNEGTFAMYAGNIAGNTAARGGGVFQQSKGTFTMYNGSIVGNTASSISAKAWGGGVYIYSGEFTMENGSISGNTATSPIGVFGGGVFMYGDTSTMFTMKKGAIDNNTAYSTNASTQGGGVAINNGFCVFLMEDGSISGNTSSTDGTTTTTTTGDAVTAYTGGVDNKGTFIMKNGLIDGNTAYAPNSRALGGGLYANGNKGTDNGQTGDTIVEGGTISGNKAIGKTDALGAGVYVAKNKPFTMKNGEISGNVAQSETDAANGGGIFSNGNVTIENGKITGNTADFGGGAYLKGYTFSMKNGEISGNTADFGGGINALAEAKVYLTADTEKTVSIEGNKANIAVGGVNSLCETHLSGKVIIKDNICENTYGSINYPENLAIVDSGLIKIDGVLTGSDIHVTHANVDTDEHDTGVLTSGYATYNDKVFTYDGPYAMIVNEDSELEVNLEKKLASGECDTNEGKGGLMARQGKIIAGNVSDTEGRTIIPITKEQLGTIENNIVVVATDGYQEFEVNVDCAYTWFYNWDVNKNELVKINAEDMGYAAFIIIDNNGKQTGSTTITGFGYYRLYADSIDNFMFDAIYRDPSIK